MSFVVIYCVWNNFFCRRNHLKMFDINMRDIMLICYYMPNQLYSNIDVLIIFICDKLKRLIMLLQVILMDTEYFKIDNSSVYFTPILGRDYILNKSLDSLSSLTQKDT